MILDLPESFLLAASYRIYKIKGSLYTASKSSDSKIELRAFLRDLTIFKPISFSESEFDMNLRKSLVSDSDDVALYFMTV